MEVEEDGENEQQDQPAAAEKKPRIPKMCEQFKTEKYSPGYDETDFPLFLDSMLSTLTDELEEAVKRFERSGVRFKTPEQVAVMKVQGFVRDTVGEVISSEPGLMRVQLLDPYDLVSPPKPGLLAWLGFTESSRPAARVLAVLEFHMRLKETDFQQLVDITLEIRPGQDPPPLDRWRAYCNKLFCEARGYFMGLQQ